MQVVQTLPDPLTAVASRGTLEMDARVQVKLLCSLNSNNYCKYILCKLRSYAEDATCRALKAQCFPHKLKFEGSNPSSPYSAWAFIGVIQLPKSLCPITQSRWFLTPYVLSSYSLILWAPFLKVVEVSNIRWLRYGVDNMLGSAIFGHKYVKTCFVTKIIP